jgi:hypothetical protein
MEHLINAHAPGVAATLNGSHASAGPTWVARHLSNHVVCKLRECGGFRANGMLDGDEPGQDPMEDNFRARLASSSGTIRLGCVS